MFYTSILTLLLIYVISISYSYTCNIKIFHVNLHDEMFVTADLPHYYKVSLSSTPLCLTTPLKPQSQVNVFN